MANPNHDESLATEILLGIRELSSSFAAQRDVFYFVMDVGAKTDEIATRIEQAKSSPTSVTPLPNEFPLEVILLEVYYPTYLSSLSDLFIRISQWPDTLDQPFNSLSSHLFHKAAELDGACGACKFALEQHTVLDALKNELDWSEEYIAKSVAENPKGRMSPSAMPRWYRDGINIGLRECIKKVESILAEHGL